jgi:hypothetical protein
MKSQDYKTHRRLVPAFHFLLFSLILIAFGCSGYNLFTHGEGEFLQSLIMLLFSIILIFLFFFTRIFALKAQDRAIRAEENLRHHILTGKGLDPRLTIQQALALRFAPDAEFLELAQKAADDKMTPDEMLFNSGKHFFIY